MTRCFGYTMLSVRVTDPDLQAQGEILQAAARSRYPDCEWGGCFDEQPPEDVEHCQGPFIYRPAGIALCRAVAAGDHVFITQVRGLLANHHNLRVSLKWFASHKVIVHFLDFDELVSKAAYPVEILHFYLTSETHVRSERLQAVKARLQSFRQKEGFYISAFGHPPPFGTMVVKALPPAFDKKGRPQMMLVWKKDQIDFLEKVVEMYEVEKLTIAKIGINLEACWNQPSTLKTDKFHDTAVIYFYELGRHYRKCSNIAARYLNLSLIPRWGSIRLRRWKPPPELELTPEQQKEIARWQYPMGWAARPCATPEERAKHLKHQPPDTGVAAT